jgi:hypothetical protein
MSVLLLCFTKGRETGKQERCQGLREGGGEGMKGIDVSPTSNDSI